MVLALVLVSQGVVQTLSPYANGEAWSSRSDPMPTGNRGRPSRRSRSGPAASQVAIKQLGTNGGGFFNVNSAHPLENPTPLSNFFELLSILLISGALCYTFGQMVGDTRQGWALLAAMTVIFVGLLAVCVWAEQSGNPVLADLGLDQRRLRAAAGRQHGGQGGALRHRQLGAVGDRHDRGVERLGQLDARLVHAARRAWCRCS